MPDAYIEGPEMVVATVNDSSSTQSIYTVPQTGSTANATLVDLPVLQVTKVQDGSEDGNTPAVFRFTRVGSSTEALKLYFRVSGTALPGDPDPSDERISLTADFKTPDGADSSRGSDVYSVSIPQGGESNSVELPLAVFSDPFAETDESVSVEILDDNPVAPGYFVNPLEALRSALAHIRNHGIEHQKSGSPPDEGTKTNLKTWIESLANPNGAIDPIILALLTRRLAENDELANFCLDCTANNPAVNAQETAAVVDLVDSIARIGSDVIRTNGEYRLILTDRLRGYKMPLVNWKIISGETKPAGHAIILGGSQLADPWTLQTLIVPLRLTPDNPEIENEMEGVELNAVLRQDVFNPVVGQAIPVDSLLFCDFVRIYELDEAV